MEKIYKQVNKSTDMFGTFFKIQMVLVVSLVIYNLIIRI